jgi:Pao retrotransposon peptidase.
VMASVEKRTKTAHQNLLSEAYSTMEEQGTSERVPEDELFPKDGRFTYYLETHPVFKESTTTKCRVVMNAASKDKHSQKSLNDMVYAGPNLLPDIAELQLRFRSKKIAIIADIKKMFLSIALHSDQDALRYLWRDFNVDLEVKVFRMLAVTFGVKSSPFQAIWCLLPTVEIFKDIYPKAAEEIRNNLYMDNLSTTADSEEEARDLLHGVITVLALGGFTTHKFASNGVGVLDGLGPDRCLQEPTIATLGLQWDTIRDSIGFNFVKKLVSKISGRVVSKRLVLEALASIYDPLGLITPFSLRAKILMQQLWSLNLDWDDPLPNDMLRVWEGWINQVPLLENHTVPRWINWRDHAEAFIASFGDASKHAYGAAIYFVTQSEHGHVHSTLIFSKSRSAPLH